MTEQDLINKKACIALFDFIFNDPRMKGQDFIDFRQSMEYEPDRIANWLLITSIGGKQHMINIQENPMAISDASNS